MSTDEARWKLGISTSFSFVLCEVAAAAIQLFMTFYVLSRCLRASRNVWKSRRLYLVVSGLLTTFSVACATITSISIFEVLYTVSGLPLQLKDDRQREMYSELWIRGDLLRYINIGIGDLLLIYRCYIICFDNIWMTVVPLVIFLANTGVAIRSWCPLWGYRPPALAAASGLLVVLLNIVVTAFISSRLLKAQKRLRESLPQSTDKIYVGAVAVLVEAAAPVAVTGLLFAIVTVLPVTRQTVIAQAVFQWIFQLSAALAPQLIIFRVVTGNSPAHREDSRELVSEEMRFGTAVSSDEESRSVS